MRNRTALRWALILAVAVAFLAVPVLALAIPSCTVTGTITAAGTGQPLAGIRIGGYYRIDTSTWGFGSAYTNSDGQYSISFNPGQSAIFSINAVDTTGTYDPKASTEANIEPGDTPRVDFVLSKDARAPRTQLYSDASIYMYLSSLGRGPAALPDSLQKNALLLSGADRLYIQADDNWYFSGRYWSYSTGSGIKTLDHSIDGQAWTTQTPANAYSVNWYENRPLWIESILPSLQDGLHSLRYRATDMNGNASGTKSQLVIVDRKPPVTTYKATSKRLQLVANDALTGAVSTFLRTGTSGAFKYGTTISVPSSGSKHVQFYSQDKVGNGEAVRTLMVSAPAWLSTPKPSTTDVRAQRSFTVRGSVGGRVLASGYLRIYKRVGGEYQYVRRAAFTENSDGFYRVTVKLNPGIYRFVTSYGRYTATWANPPVSSARSEMVNVW
jgi:hypothetical protein